MNWTVADARRRFADFLRASEGQPQHIERYGELSGVMISGKLYQDFQAFQDARSGRSVGAAFQALRAIASEESCGDISKSNDEGSEQKP